MDNNKQHGFAYQLKLLLLFLHRTFSNCDPATELSKYEYRFYTEKTEAGKFDDVILQLRQIDGAWKLRLFQAKHSEKENKSISKLDILSPYGSFPIEKYFQSFLEIRKRCRDHDSIFANCEIMDLSIITNIMIDKEIKDCFALANDENDYLIFGPPTTTSQSNINVFKFQNTDCGTANLLKERLIKTNCTVDVDEFIEKFRLIHFPDRHGVDELLNQELQCRFGNIDSELIKSRFTQKTYEWMVDRRSTYHTKETTAQLFTECQHILDHVVLKGNTEVNFRKVYNDVFQFQSDSTLNDFLQSDNKMCHFKVDDMKFGRSKLRQHLKEYDPNDSLGNMYFLLMPDNDEKLWQKCIQCFSDPKYCKLLILELHSKVTDRILRKEFHQLKKILIKSSSKKVLIISKLGSQFVEELKLTIGVFDWRISIPLATFTANAKQKY